ncbi:hypothetical protein RCL1_002378 [Eukaryota sp. TZLM3-RCL]
MPIPSKQNWVKEEEFIKPKPPAVKARAGRPRRKRIESSRVIRRPRTKKARTEADNENEASLRSRKSVGDVWLLRGGEDLNQHFEEEDLGMDESDEEWALSDVFSSSDDDPDTIV